MTASPTRRQLLTAALATGAAVTLGGAGRATAATPRLTMPRPTGPHRIGTVALHLIDADRREMMAGVWYPASPAARRHPVAPWLPAAPMRALLTASGFDVVAAPLTAAHVGAPVLPAAGRRPVVVFSHGSNGTRSETTVVVQELASHGYVVVTVDHPDDSYSELPGGRLTVPDDDVSVTPWDHARDIRFVLDRIEDLAAGRNPDAGRRRLPHGLGAALDLRRIGMFGFSKGATATALVMNTDRRVRAGLSLDGQMQSEPPVERLDRPFMVMTGEFTREHPDARVGEFWSLLHGWRLQVRADGALHPAYCDPQWLVPQLARIAGWDDDELAGWIGTLDPALAVRVQQAYPLAFFDQHLRGRRSRLLEGPTQAFPTVRYLP